MINFKKSKQKEKSLQDYIYEDAEYVRELLDNLATNKLYLMPSEEYRMIQKILIDLNILMSMEYENEDIDQIIGFEKAQEYIAKILSQVHYGEKEVFEKEDNIYVN